MDFKCEAIMNININVEGVDDVNNAFKKIRNELKDFSIPLIKSGDYYIQEIKQNFDEEGTRLGNGWVPLKDRTILEKIKLFSEGKAIAITKPLIRSGFLKNSFIWTLPNNFNLLITSFASYAELMHRGGINEQGKRVPARTITKIDEIREKKVLNFFEKWLEEKIIKHIG